MKWKYLPLAAVALLFGPVASLSGCSGGSQSRVSAEATSYNISGTITPVANGAGGEGDPE